MQRQLSAQNYCDRGREHFKQERYQAAIEDFTQALQMKPVMVEVYRLRGCAYREAGMYQQAHADFQKALELNPNNVTVYYNRGYCYRLQSNFSAAVEDYTKALEFLPKDIDALLARGISFKLMGKLDKAEEDYLRVISLSPGNTMACNNLSIIYCDQSKYEEALKLINEAVASAPEESLYYQNRAYLNSKLGHHLAVVNDFITALTLKPLLHKETFDLLQVSASAISPDALLKLEDKSLSDAIKVLNRDRLSSNRETRIKRKAMFQQLLFGNKTVDEQDDYYQIILHLVAKCINGRLNNPPHQVMKLMSSLEPNVFPYFMVALSAAGCVNAKELHQLSELMMPRLSNFKNELVEAIKAIESPVDKASACCKVLIDKTSAVHAMMFAREKGLFKSAPENSQQVKAIRATLDNLLAENIARVSQLPDYAQQYFNKALAVAIKDKKAEQAKKLLKIGANPNFVDPQKNNCPLLMLAMVAGLTDVCTALLLHGANAAVEFTASKAVHAGLVASLSRDVQQRMNVHLMASSVDGDISISAMHYSKIIGNVETENNICLRMQASNAENFVPVLPLQSQGLPDLFVPPASNFSLASYGSCNQFGLFSYSVALSQPAAQPPSYETVVLADVLNPGFYKITAAHVPPPSYDESVSDCNASPVSQYK